MTAEADTDRDARMDEHVLRAYRMLAATEYADRHTDNARKLLLIAMERDIGHLLSGDERWI